MRLFSHTMFVSVCECCSPCRQQFQVPSADKLILIKNFLRTTMKQDRLSIESEIAKSVDFDTVIRNVDKKKARKAALFVDSYK